MRRSEGYVCAFSVARECVYAGNTGGCAEAGNPPAGGASIAPGYTLGAFAGAKPRHPLPLKGRELRGGADIQSKKTAIVTVRMMPDVRQRLQERARDAHMSLTIYLIICGLDQEIVRVDGPDAVLSELKAQGRSLNQLTTLANMGRLTVLRSNELIDSYAALCEQVSRLTEVS